MLLNCKIKPNTRATSPDGYSERGQTKSTTSNTCTYFKKILLKNFTEAAGTKRSLILHTVFSGDYLLLNCKIEHNARATSPDLYSERGQTKSTSDTCTTFTLG